jgi:hypothetical protein
VVIPKPKKPKMPTLEGFFQNMARYFPLEVAAEQGNGDSIMVKLYSVLLHRDYNPVFGSHHPGMFSYTIRAECQGKEIVFEAAPFVPSQVSILSQAYLEDEEEEDDAAPLSLSILDIHLQCHAKLKRPSHGEQGKQESQDTARRVRA